MPSPSKRTKKSTKQVKVPEAKLHSDNEVSESESVADDVTVGTSTPDNTELNVQSHNIAEGRSLAGINVDKGNKRPAPGEGKETEDEPPLKKTHPDEDKEAKSLEDHEAIASPTEDAKNEFVPGFTKKSKSEPKSVDPVQRAEYLEFKAQASGSTAFEDPNAAFAMAIAAALENTESNPTATGVKTGGDVGPSSSSVCLEGEAAPPPKDKPDVYLEDVDKRPVTVPMKNSNVNKPEHQDPLLRAQYEGLPLLPDDRSIYGWSEKRSTIQEWTKFSMWGQQCPDLNVKYVTQFNETGSGPFINPSRIAPFHLSTRPVYTKADARRLYASGAPAICVSTIYSVKSYLLGSKPSGRPQKALTGIFHDQEWQRFEALVCLAFERNRLKAQYNEHALEFATRAQPIEENSNVATHAVPGMFGSNKPSGSSESRSSTSFKAVLDFEDEVPVYDARKSYFKIESELTLLAEKLPRFEEEIPEGSFVIVGYTTSMYTKDKVPNLSCAIQWAIVCGTPL
ncbi:hypothetical protein Hypma_006901 [Hypsizygus marmoreus]|uniref:Uncharacterized protein n=1 Tax=Hypsizygus marmoreus TaxID=39966 RepID=A0A369JUS9_HYPMA|nr:hypothetical protein Hypma_006901 [Hypsizygus marmoreus]